MNFLSVLYAKAGITVDGVTTLNNTATGLTPATNDNSTKLATTGYVKNQNYYPYPTGTTSQYVRGDGSLATFTQTGGGGSSVSYYLNGGVSQGTIGGNTYYEMSKTAIIGTNADFTINANGYIAQFVTDAGDPALLNIPGGNWNFEMFFSASSGGGSPRFYVELYKYDGTTLTLIASGSAIPEYITGGTSTDLYVTALAVPTTTLTLTDRLAIRVYVNNSGRTITLHTQDNHLCQIITTFTTGLTALNGLTAQVQNFAVGAGGSDFNISSVTDTHTFNLPTASATKRGALSSIDWSAFDAKVDFGDLSATSPLSYNGSGVFSIAQSSTSTNGYVSSTDWNTFNNKQNALTNPVTGTGTTNYITKWTSGSAVGNSSIVDDGAGNVYVYSRLFQSNGTNQMIFGQWDGVNNRIEGSSGLPMYMVTYGSALKFGVGGDEKAQINSLGNLLVGTATSIWATGNRGIIQVNGASQALIGLSVGDVEKAYLYHNGSNLAVWNVANGYIEFGTNNTTRLTILASGAATFSSSVTATSLIKSGGTSSQYLMADGSTSTLTNPITGTGTTNYLPKFTGASALGNSLVYDSGTAIGIGTATAYSKLSIAGSGGSLSAVSSIQFYDSNSGGSRNFSWSNGAGGNQVDLIGKFILSASSAVNGDALTGNALMAITSAGNVGIGTTSPNIGGWSKALTLQGSANAAYEVTDGTVRTAVFSSAATIGGVSVETNHPLGLYTNGTERMRITSAGNVLIGTTTDAGYKLSVNGQASIGSGAQAIVGTDGTYAGYSTIGFGGTTNGYNRVFGNSGTADGLYLAAATSKGIAFWTNGANQRMFITSGGNVLINITTDAGYKLDVNGTARVSGAFTVSTGRTGLFSGDNFSLGLAQTVGQANYFYLGTNSSGDLLMSETGGVAKLTITQAGAATFSSTVNATSFTAGNRTILTSSGIYDNQANGNNIGIGFGSSTIISTTGDGTYSAQNLGSATYPWYSARFVDRVTSLAWTTTGRNYSNEWIEFPNYSGLYSANNNAHFHPNGSSYGAWKVQGQRNGWNGLEFGDLFNGNISLMIAGDSTLVGFHNNASAWIFYWSAGELKLSKGTYGGGALATVLDSNNYNSYAPTLTGSGASGTWGINITGNAATATNISNAGTVTLATATEANSIYITQPSYTTDTPVKLLNFAWYSDVWSMGNIRSSYSASNGFGIYLSGSEKVRITPSGNFLINTTTDAGFKLDVNGTARVQGAATFSSSITTTNGYISANYNAGDVITWGGIAPYANVYGALSWDVDKAIVKGRGGYALGLYVDNNVSKGITIATTGVATFTSSVTATNFIVPGGTSAQFLKADGSLDSSVYLTSTSSTFSYTASVTLSPTWQNTGVSSANLGSGVYLVSCYAHDFAVGGLQYECTYAGIMYFFAGTTNGSNANEIVLHHTGHADNGRYIYLRTLNTVSADGKTYLQISGNGTNSAASNYQFTFKKLL